VALCASGFVTTTLSEPAACAGVVPVMVVALIVETVTPDPPNDTVAPVWKPVPAIVTVVPPPLAPVFGLTEVIAGGGGAPYVKQATQVALCESRLVTTTFTGPLVCAAVVPVMLVGVTDVTASADPPSVTAAPA